jgi:hypothetical protein
MCAATNNSAQMLKKSAISGVIWLTAVSTLVAGSPHLTCRCPDGSIKLFCIARSTSITPSGSGHKSCCATGSTQHPCCQENPVARVRQNGDGPALTALCCQKNLVQPEAAVAQGPDAPLHVLLTIPLDSFTFLPAVPSLTHRESTYRPESSPVDLLLVLQHFLI